MDLATDSEIGQSRAASPHSLDSSLREQALAHIFLGQLLSHMWRNGRYDIEVLKSEVDQHGYDVVLESRRNRSSHPAQIAVSRVDGQSGRYQHQAACQTRWLRHLDRIRSRYFIPRKVLLVRRRTRNAVARSRQPNCEAFEGNRSR